MRAQLIHRVFWRAPSVPQPFPSCVHVWASAPAGGAMTHTSARTMATAHPASVKPVIRGVVFDMDGTLTVPVIDFAEMRRRVGVQHGDILDYIAGLAPEDQARAHAAIAEIEDKALLDMKLMPGCRELAAWLDSHRVPRAIITRNVKQGVAHFHAHHFNDCAPFSPAVTRECQFAYKPSPEALLHICSEWGISPSECVMVGDSVKDDVVCGNRAGAVTVLIDIHAPASGDGAPPGEGTAPAVAAAADWHTASAVAEGLGAAAGQAAEGGDPPCAAAVAAAAAAQSVLEGECKPHYVVSGLPSIRTILERHFSLQGGAGHYKAGASIDGAAQ